MYGGLGVSAPSLHRESTDSLIIKQGLQYTCVSVFSDDHCILLTDSGGSDTGQDQQLELGLLFPDGFSESTTV